MTKQHQQTNRPSTSWEPVGQWYHQSVGEEGHYYHQRIVLPGVLRLLNLKEAEGELSLLDLACGNGVLARHLPSNMSYTGVDLSPSLIKNAERESKRTSLRSYHVGDATMSLPLPQAHYSHVTILLAIQNMREPKRAFANAAKHLRQGGRLVVAMNHPCFRIPRQSSWMIDETKKIQYRRIDRYLSPMEIPIHAHPSHGENSSATISFHHPLCDYFLWLHEAGFSVEMLEEWHSDKQSYGKNAKMENRSRSEIPLFLALSAIKSF